MTCIVGWADPQGQRVCIGGDSAAMSGLNLMVRADEKVFRNGEMLFGCTTSFRMTQLLRFSLRIPSQPVEKGDYEFLCTDVVDAIRACLKVGGFARLENGVERGGSFIIGYRGHIYAEEDDFQVAQPQQPFYAVGCGESFAYGACWILREDGLLSLAEKVKRALEVAHQCNGGVRPPYVVLQQTWPEGS
ncbi:MAG: hypothetical protein NW237_15685 [Cyanobacteriota bacterium]|nr:hypothetical protein [Cyanobacteriota bacterium]